MRVRYLHLDVFTDRPFEGNQLAVFPDSAGLSTEDMQRITHEMNLSECTFVLPAEVSGTDVRMRIFTPGEELPMAGHPTIGSTFALAAESAIASGRTGFVFGLGIGPTPVSLEWHGSDLDFVWMTQSRPTFGGRIDDRAGFAQAIGVAPADLLANAPIEIVSCGVPFLLAPLTLASSVDRVAIDRRQYAACCKAAGVDERPLFTFALVPGASGGESVYSRMLAPGLGIGEDPATGSASGPLGCYLAAHNLLGVDRLSHFISLQGVAMRRPSRIHVSIGVEADAVTSVRVGGRSVLVGGGVLEW
ncbi:MAG: PhzF family phenazine biosynthesis protein [Vicinamibacterales bacterium]